MADSATALIRRWNDLLSERSTWEGQWQDIGDYIVPNKRNVQFRPIAPGAKQTEKLFDSTALQANGLLASSLHSALTPSTQPWLSLIMRDESLNQTQSVRMWLEDTARRMHRGFKQSGFSEPVHEMFIDICSFATGCLFVEERAPTAQGQFQGFRFRTFPIGEWCLAENWEGRVDTLFRVFTLTARAAVGKWGDKVGEWVNEKARSKPEEKVEFLHAVYPRKDRLYGRQDAKNLPWVSCYLVKDKKIKVEEGGFHEFPYMVPRWSKTSGEQYGRGPSHLALPDIKSVNAAKEFILKAAPLAMQPPTLERHEAVVGEPDLTPAGRNVVEGQGPLTEQLMFLDTKNRPDMSQLVLQDLRQAILEMYFIPQLRLKDSPQMTATEVQARIEEMYRYLGPQLSRLEAEFLNPLVERAFGIMARAGAFAPLPPELAELGQQADLDIEYEGPLARAQRTIELAAQDRIVSWVVAVEPTHPEVGEVPDWEKMLRARSEIVGLPSDQMKSEEAVKRLREQRQQREEAQQQVAMAEQVAGAAGKAAPMLKELHAAAMNTQNGAGPGG